MKTIKEMPEHSPVSREVVEAGPQVPPPGLVCAVRSRVFALDTALALGDAEAASGLCSPALPPCNRLSLSVRHSDWLQASNEASPIKTFLSPIGNATLR